MKATALVLAAGLAVATAAAAQTPAPASPPADITTGTVTAGAGAAANLRQMTIDTLTDMDLVGLDGKEIGEIEGVVESANGGARFALVERGGVLGFGAKTIAIPLENLVVQGDRVMLRNMDLAALDAMPTYKNENKAYRELDDEQQINVPQQ
ncbi:PRC-barrel domain-containing protein [Salinarimonas soli]|uniref:PRC-barrel domain containing protein n=1 Tax=Salinarimonas soli TaxID=1638099 RepID=A0A5B2V8B2_9HYPH|nr:PRC-barrel domain-containing protein [Salinarimonas soli]KAA2234672.1 PRC-barrel domain containing protein [Salinarimonas soli]